MTSPPIPRWAAGRGAASSLTAPGCVISLRRVSQASTGAAVGRHDPRMAADVDAGLASAGFPHKTSRLLLNGVVWPSRINLIKASLLSGMEPHEGGPGFRIRSHLWKSLHLMESVLREAWFVLVFPPFPGKRLQTFAAFTFSFPFQSSSHICEQGREKSFFSSRRTI